MKKLQAVKHSPKLKMNQKFLKLIYFVGFSSVLTNVLGLIPSTLAATSSSTSSVSSDQTSQSASQPLWSYQVKPNSYLNVPSSQSHQQQQHYGSTGPTYGVGSGLPSIFDAFSGLSQRQGALTGSPFLSILPIILIAAGGMLLLLPLLTMMMASPFGGGFGGGFNNGPFGYPQVGALNKKRSLNDNSQHQRGILEMIENFSSTVEELTKKYANNGSLNPKQRSAKAVNSAAQELLQPAQQSPANHRSSAPASANAIVAEEFGIANGAGGGGGGSSSSSNGGQSGSIVSA